MSIKMVVVDMDGTLLNDKGNYDKIRFAKIFNTLKAKNIHFVVASGSQYQRLKNKFKRFVNEMDFISQNGSVVHTGKKLYHSYPILDKDILLILKAVKRVIPQFSVYQIVICGINKAYVDQNLPEKYFNFVHRFFTHLVRYKNLKTIRNYKLIDDQITKILFNFASQNQEKQRIDLLRKILPSGFISENSGFNTTLIGNAKATKGAAISILKRKYQISANQIIAFGDNQNDLSMFKETPFGYAMKNSSFSIKNKASKVTTKDNNHDGVLDVLEKIFLK